MKFPFYLIISLIVFASTSCQTQSKSVVDETIPAREWSANVPEQVVPVKKSKDEWKSELTDMEYYVLREKGTERSFSGDLLNNKKEGLYVCRGCGLPLFTSDTKFKSGTGWPSFFQPIKEEFIHEDTDYNIGYARTELTCARCGGHQGHVFPDGPAPTGLRYCINSASLDFVETKE